MNPDLLQSNILLKCLNIQPRGGNSDHHQEETKMPFETNTQYQDDEITMEEQIDEFSQFRIDEFEQRGMVNSIYNHLQIFGNNADATSDQKCVNCSPSILTDLEVFENYERAENAPTLFEKINYTQTYFGENILKKVLQKPSYNIEVLLTRSAVIRQCMENPVLFSQISAKVREMRDEQKNILWFYQELDEYRKNIYDMIYFQYPYIDFFNHYLNKNSTFLLLLQTYKIFVTPLITILTPIFTVLIPIVVWKMTGSKIPFTLLCKFLFKFVFQTMWSTDSYKTILFTIASIGIWIFFYVQTLYSYIQIAQQTYKINKIIQQKMHSLYKWIKALEELTNICQSANIPINWIHPSSNSIPLSIEVLKERVGEMRSIVDYGVLKDEHKMFNHKGLILSQYYIFLKNRDKMNDLLYFFGQMDVLQALVTLATEHKYSLTKFVDEQDRDKDKDPKNEKSGPVIKMSKIWHPYLSNNKTIKNSLKMKKEKLWLIMGPNAAGKSTFIKSVMLNILFAQTICISPCKEMTITPFHNLFTYLHIPDTKGKQSLFQAEMMRNKVFLEELDRGEKENRYTFMIMDELFSSTNYQEGVSAAYSILTKISGMRNNRGLTTSHFYELMNLEKDTKKKIRNYYFDVNVHDLEEYAKHIEYTYKIKKGTTNKRIAIDLLQQENFDPEIIENALKIFKKMANGGEEGMKWNEFK